MNAHIYRIALFVICFVVFFTGAGYSDSLKETQFKIIKEIQREVSLENSNNATGVSFVRKILGKSGTLVADFRGDKNESVEMIFEGNITLVVRVNFNDKNKYLLGIISKAMSIYVLSESAPPMQLIYSVSP